jgi:hypothetical protein
MNNNSKRLLEELLEEAAPAEFREALMRNTLCQVRRRRRVRALNRVLLMAALVVGLPVLFWRAFVFAPERPASRALVSPIPEPASYHLVRSQPLNPAMIVETQPGTTPLVSSLSGSVAVVETKPGEHLFKELTDEQLLALLAGKPVGLVRYSPEHAELVFP